MKEIESDLIYRIVADFLPESERIDFDSELKSRKIKINPVGDDYGEIHEHDNNVYIVTFFSDETTCCVAEFLDLDEAVEYLAEKLNPGE